MEETIETTVLPQDVWAAWERAHKAQGQELKEGKRGKEKFKYEILEVVQGKSFSICWKTLFVRLIFHHEVIPHQTGAKIFYKVEIKGPFAIPVRFFLKDKIQNNIRYVLKAIVRELETKNFQRV